ncbi:MAG TPA: hypothetical protein VE778_04930, partial [Candidatus Bathyarchaeia archaeon]|nr:hypothetical protein [Candidatus Bathyarchaeia archaeon]
SSDLPAAGRLYATIFRLQNSHRLALQANVVERSGACGNAPLQIDLGTKILTTSRVFLLTEN